MEIVKIAGAWAIALLFSLNALLVPGKVGKPGNVTTEGVASMVIFMAALVVIWAAIVTWS